MSARPKLTDDQIAFVRYTMNRKREILRQLKLMPTLDDLANELGCSRRYLAAIVTNKVRVVPRETSSTVNIPMR